MPRVFAQAVEQLRGWPQRRIADPAFRRWAAGFWLTRWVARRRARALFDLVAGFVHSQVLLACVQLRLFDRLADGPLPAAQLAQQLQLPPDRAARLFDAAVALRLLLRRGDRLALGALGASMVANPAVAAMVEHHRSFYDDLRDPVALLRGELGDTALGRYWPYAGSGTPRSIDPAAAAAYSALMSASQPLVADEVLDAVDLSRSRCLMDVGGGEGLFLAAVAQRHPHLTLQLLDLPPVAALAHRRLQALGLGGRAQCHGGDFLREPLPRGADVISLLRVVHDQDDAGARTLLRAAYEALPPGGRLLLAEPLAATAGAEAMGDAYFGWYLLAMGRGRARSAAELGTWLHEAGFAEVRVCRTRLPLQTGLLVAQRGH